MSRPSPRSSIRESPDRYAILSVGTSVGRGYGPVLVSRDELRWRTCAAGASACPASRPPAGSCSAGFCPEAVPVEMPFDQIAEAVAAGELDAGVMIHEELLYYPRLGLRPRGRISARSGASGTTCRCRSA